MTLYLRDVLVLLDYLHDLIYHFIIVLFPITIYKTFFKEDRQTRRLLLSKFLSILLIVLILTMSNPVAYAGGFLYDLRVIPIILAYLYGGLYPGLVAVAFMLLFQLVIGGESFVVTFMNYTVASILLIMIMRKYDSLPMKTRIYLISAFYLGIANTRGIVLISKGQYEYIPFMLLFSVLTFVTIITLVFMIENINRQFTLKEELARAEKLNVISQLAASIAHEVRNPLTSIKGFMQLMKEESELKSSQKYYIDIALVELDRTEAIINEYLSLAKPTSLQTEKINLSSVIQSTIDLMTSYTNVNNIVIHSSIENSLFVKGKKGEIKQVLLNIIKNGIEATHPNGSITIRAFNNNTNHIIEVIDTGIGMTKEQIKRLGTPFYTTKDIGTGVGLSISYNIIKNMKGTIEVESEENKGTKFTIRLPVYHD